MHYYPHHIGDFIKETANLNDHQLATYLRMIWAYYLDEKPFDNDCESIAFAVRSDEKTVRLLLKHYFELIEDKWHQKRCDREIEHYRTNSEKSRKAAEARWNKHNQKQQTQSQCNSDAMHTHTETDANASLSNANQEPRTKNHINKPDKPTKKQTVASKPNDVSDNVWNDWITHRRKKNAIVTDLVMDQHKEEASKAGLTLDQALTFAISNGWQAFNATYWANATGNKLQTAKSNDMFQGAI
jgi:uncharacterized protein YdaU (DUF1376 family)